METPRKDGDQPDIYLSPYEVWNFGEGIDYAFPGVRKYSKYISAFAELVPTSTEQQTAKPDLPGQLPTIWAKYRKARFLPFVAENPDSKPLTLTRLKEILGVGLVSAFQIFSHLQGAAPRTIEQGRFRVALPIPKDAVHEHMPEPKDPTPNPDKDLYAAVKGKRLTIIAVIDDGIPFAHRNFRDASGRRTRLEFCWLQSATVLKEQNSVLFGREYVRDDIETLIADFGNDEDELYRQAGATKDADDFGSLLDNHTTHGAHVMNLAAGYDPAHDGEPPETIRIIAVQLPNSVTMDTSGFGKDMYILAAFHYILNRADIIKKMYQVDDPRLVINFSYGYTGGRHDGETELEAAIHELIDLRRGIAPTALVLASGNTFLDRLHATIHSTDFPHSGGTVTLPWRIQPNNRTTSYLELWFWGNFQPSRPFDFVIELYDPNGNIVALRDEGGDHHTALQVGADNQGIKGGDPIRVFAALNAQKQAMGQLSADWHRADGNGGASRAAEATSDQYTTGRWRVLIVVAPTEPEDHTLPGAPAGKWTVAIRREFSPPVADEPIHYFIQRATDFESFRSGSRQSYFDDDAYEQTRFTPQGDLSEEDSRDPAFKTYIGRFGSLNGLATGKTSLVVGGYRLGAGLHLDLACARPARYSAAGTLDGIGKTVDCSSMADRSRALPGTVSTGVRSGSRSFLQGTSVAASVVARRLAEIFATRESIPSEPDDNYLSLLRYPPQTGEETRAPADNDLDCRPDDLELIKARLGEVLVAPNWQPGNKDRVCLVGRPADASASTNPHSSQP